MSIDNNKHRLWRHDRTCIVCLKTSSWNTKCTSLSNRVHTCEYCSLKNRSYLLLHYRAQIGLGAEKTNMNWNIIN